METGLHGRAALITGGATGIGRATALALAAEQAQVIIADVDADGAAATVAAIADAGGQARALRCDVTDEADVAAAVASVLGHEGRLDVMVNNAGVGGHGAPLHELELEEWEWVQRINLRGVFLGVKHAARAMLAGGSGSIVNIASVAALTGTPGFAHYGASKAGVVQLTYTAAQEPARAGIRVNAICPGWVDTAILGSVPDEQRPRLVRQIPMRRLGQPAEVASMVVYLASDAAAFVTGSVMRVDGGMRS